MSAFFAATARSTPPSQYKEPVQWRSTDESRCYHKSLIQAQINQRSEFKLSFLGVFIKQKGVSEVPPCLVLLSNHKLEVRL